MVQGPAGGLDRPVDVRIGAQRRGAEGLLGGGLQRAVRVGAERVNPLAVDEEPGPVQVGVSVSGDGHKTLLGKLGSYTDGVPQTRWSVFSFWTPGAWPATTSR